MSFISMSILCSQLSASSASRAFIVRQASGFTLQAPHSQLTSILRGTSGNTALLTHLKVPCNRFDTFAETLGHSISPGAQRILTTRNAGGNSVSSEALSFEFFHRLIGADLLLTEMECTYVPGTSPMADYVALLPSLSLPIAGGFAVTPTPVQYAATGGGIAPQPRVLGVSVTRAVLKPGLPYRTADARRLLTKKLCGLHHASQNIVLPEPYATGRHHPCGANRRLFSVLHVLAPNSKVARIIRQAHKRLPQELQAIAGVVVTVVRLDSVFWERSRRATRRP